MAFLNYLVSASYISDGFGNLGSPSPGASPGTLTDDATGNGIDGDNFFVLDEPIFNGADSPIGPYIGSFSDINGTYYVVELVPDFVYAVFSPDVSVIANFPATIPLASLNTDDAQACFLDGTRIATPGGACSVESLAIGDTVLSTEGRAVAVKWIGRQTVSTRFGPAERLMPVRVRAGALGDGLPLRDLSLTADHALLIDGLLINAGALVNGGSIDYVPLSEFGGSYTVYHVETENHDIILAEGAPAETFIDYLGRQAFDNYAEYLDLYGEDRTIPEMAFPRISAARHLPPAIRSRLAPCRAA